MKTLLSYLLIPALTLTSAFASAVDLPIKKDGSYVSTESVAGATTVDAAKAHELWKARAVFIDTRTPGQYDTSHIPGAVNLEYEPGKPNQQLTAESLKAQVPQSEPVVIYCNAEKCDRSSWGSALAVEWGWKKVYYFRNGVPAWTKAGFPLQ